MISLQHKATACPRFNYNENSNNNNNNNIIITTLHVSHDGARIDIIIIEHVADTVLAPVGGRDVPVLVAVVAVPPVVVTLPVRLLVPEVVRGRGEVEREVGVGPELGLLATPPHFLEHLVAVDIASYGHFLQFQIHFHCIYTCRKNLRNFSFCYKKKMQKELCRDTSEL